MHGLRALDHEIGGELGNALGERPASTPPRLTFDRGSPNRVFVNVRSLMTCACLSVSLLFGAGAARAESGEWTLWGGLGGQWSQVGNAAGDVDDRWVLPSLEIGAVLALDDYWQIGVSCSAGPSFLGDASPEPAERFGVEARFIIDALTWVPYLSAGVAAVVHHQEVGAARLDGALFGGFGMDYRPQRAWSLGGFGRAWATVTGPSHTSLTLDFQVVFSFYVD